MYMLCMICIMFLCDQGVIYSLMGVGSNQCTEGEISWSNVIPSQTFSLSID